MTHSESIEAQLLAAPAIVALVGNRIYPLMALSPDSRTALIYKIRLDFIYALSGAVIAKLNPLIIRSFAVDYNQAHALANAVRATLSPVGSAKGFQGVMGGAGGINVLGCRIQDEEEDYVALTPDQGVFEVRSTYILEYQPTG